MPTSKVLYVRLDEQVKRGLEAVARLAGLPVSVVTEAMAAQKLGITHPHAHAVARALGRYRRNDI